MQQSWSGPVRLLAGLATVVLAATACGGGGGAGGGGGSLAAIDLSGASFTAGSKEFTEQIVLGQIAVQALEATGADVGDLTTITGSTNVRTALTAGELDMYWEYTTGWTAHLQKEPSAAPDGENALYQAVVQEDRQNGVAWLQPAPLDNTYAIATRQGRDQQLGVRTLSDYAALVENCNFGEVFATEGAVAANDLVVLEDDKQFFVPYNAAMTVRQDVLDRHPQLAEVFTPIAERLTTDVMRGLNERVDVGGELPEDVAEQFLRDNGFIA